MLSRVSGLTISALWVTAMTWLVWHDVVPRFTAERLLPQLNRARLADPRLARTQMAVFNDAGERIGTTWTVYAASERSISRYDRALLTNPGGVLPPLRLEGTATYSKEGLLDEFTLELVARGVERGLTLHGERFPSYFAFELDVGAARFQTFKLPATEAAMLADALNPFVALPALEVGRSWVVQVFNPVAAMFGRARRFTPVLVRVTGRERIPTLDGPRDCFVIRAGASTAWVDEDGVAYVQELALPGGSRWRVVRERFDERAFNGVRASRLRGEWGS